MWSFNASDIEGSLPGSFPLLNKNTPIWSIFVIRLIGQVFCRLPFHLLAAHILNLSDTASLRNFWVTWYMYNIYSGSEICVVVLFRTDLDSWLPDGSSTLFFRILTISLADFKGKIQSGSYYWYWIQLWNKLYEIPLVFEVRLSRYDPDTSP